MCKDSWHTAGLQKRGPSYSLLPVTMPVQASPGFIRCCRCSPWNSIFHILLPGLFFHLPLCCVLLFIHGSQTSTRSYQVLETEQRTEYSDVNKVRTATNRMYRRRVSYSTKWLTKGTLESHSCLTVALWMGKWSEVEVRNLVMRAGFYFWLV